jgi:hypothetical protein
MIRKLEFWDRFRKWKEEERLKDEAAAAVRRQLVMWITRATGH